MAIIHTKKFRKIRNLWFELVHPVSNLVITKEGTLQTGKSGFPHSETMDADYPFEDVSFGAPGYFDSCHKDAIHSK